MTALRFSNRARSDLRDIAAYSIETWDKASGRSRTNGPAHRCAAGPPLDQL